ncbi:hypothetical protein EV363DRAFT_1435590 [Boletus edulis]|nr:hypothetical protein EV363DRAFT_1435590 [Boletus edulis]
MLMHEYHGIRGYLVGVSRPLCVPCMAFAGILSASGRPLCVPCMRSWLWRANPCASHVCYHGSGGYLVSVSRPLWGPWISYIQLSSVRVRVPPAILSAPGGCAGSGRRLPGKLEAANRDNATRTIVE